MAVGTGARFVVDFDQVKEMLADLDDAKDALNSLDSLRGIRGYSPAGTRMTRELRKQVRLMSQRVIIPELQDKAAGTGSEFDQRIAASARAVNDRLPVVKVGYVNPKLSGFQRTKVGDRKSVKGSLAFGSEYGPKGGARSGKHAGLGVNYYGMGRKRRPPKSGTTRVHPRNERGYWIYWAINSARVTRGVIQGYGEVVDAIFERWQWGPRSGDVTRAA